MIIGERPNTYSFTKAITEQMIKEDRGDLPISIVRPSIVVGAVSEPLPGWVDNINGPTSVGVFISQVSKILVSQHLMGKLVVKHHQIPAVGYQFTLLEKPCQVNRQVDTNTIPLTSSL